MTIEAGNGRSTRGIAIPALAFAVMVLGGLVGVAAQASAAPPTVPKAPQMFGLLTVDTDPTLHVAFHPDLDDGGSAVLHYDASCTSDDGGDPADASGFGTSLLGFLVSGYRELAVTGATAGSTYTCTVTATNSVGTSVESDESLPAVAGKPVHGFVSATVGATSIELEALPTSADLGYTVTCTSSNGGAPRTAGSGTVHIVVSGLTAGKTYDCAERAFVPGGTSSAATTGDFIAGRPTQNLSTGAFIIDIGSDLTDGAGNGSITVQIPDGYQSYLPITAFRATCTSSNGGPTGVGTASGTATTVLVSGLQNGKSYTCTLAAANANGFGLDGPATEPIVPGRPVPPLVYDVTPGIGQLSIDFVPGDSPGNPTTRWDAACTSSDGGASGTGFITNPQQPIVVSGLTDGKSYTCTINGTNVRGTGRTCDGNLSSFGCTDGPLSMPIIVGRPTPPNELTVVAIGSGTVQVDGAAPDHTGGTAVEDYTAQCRSVDGGVSSVVSSGFPITLTGLTDGKIYECRARASNVDGAGLWGEAGAAVIPGRPSEPLLADEFPAATPGDGQLTMSFAPPVYNGGSAITGYDVTCSAIDDYLPTDVHTASGSASPITVTGLTNGVLYYCAVTANNASGAGTAAVEIGQPGPDAPPTITSAIPGDGSIAVTFEPAANALTFFASYRIVCSSSDGGVTHTTIADFLPFGTVTHLTNGKSYTCRVNAVVDSFNGTQSAKSAVVKPGLPTAPRGLTATPGNGQVKLVFSAPVTSGGFARTGYRATCGSTNGGVGRVQTGSGSPITVTGVTNTKNYNCTVAAVNAKGTGIGATKSSIVPGLPTVPRSVSAVPVDEGVASVKFTAPAFNGGAGIIGYGATCTSSNGGATKSKTGTGSPLTVAGMTDGKTYTCKVTAKTSKGTGPSAASSAFKSGAPSAPRNVLAEVGVSGQVTVTFSAPAGTGGANIASYQVTCTSSTGGATGSKTLGASPITVDGLDNLETYSCTVKPQSTGGDGLTATVSGIFVHDAS
jgi:titin